VKAQITMYTKNALVAFARQSQSFSIVYSIMVSISSQTNQSLSSVYNVEQKANHSSPYIIIRMSVKGTRGFTIQVGA